MTRVLSSGPASPVGPAGGGLGGTYPNPTVSGGGGLPFSATQISYSEHFLGDVGLVNLGGITGGALDRWWADGSNGGSVGSVPAPASGIMQLATHNSLNDWCSLDWGQATYLWRQTTGMTPVCPDGIFEWYVQLTGWTPASDKLTVRLGLCDDATAGRTSGAPVNEIGFILNTSAGTGGNWKIATAAGSGETATAATTHAVAADTAWHTFRITISSSVATFSIDGLDQGVTKAAAVLSSAALGPFVKIVTNDTVSRTLLADYFQSSGTKAQT